MVYTNVRVHCRAPTLIYEHPHPFRRFATSSSVCTVHCVLTLAVHNDDDAGLEIYQDFICFISLHLLYLFFFIKLQLVHQFTSSAETLYCYTVKTIKKLKIIYVQCKLRHVSVFHKPSSVSILKF